MLLDHVKFLVFGALVVATHAVTVKMVGIDERLSYYCTNIRPSQCCKAISYGLAGGCIPSYIFHTFLWVNFYNLPPSTIAASFWPRFGIEENCNGPVKESKYMANGGDAYLYTPEGLPQVTGGGYVKCSEPKAHSGWLSLIAGLCVSFLQHGVTSPRAWWANDLAPEDEMPRSVYPDIITIDGTNYTDGNLGNMMYISDSGEIINLNPIGRSSLIPQYCQRLLIQRM